MNHISNYNANLKDATKNRISSSKICCYPDAKITLIEEFPCESKKELEKREGEITKRYIEDDELDDVVNRQIAGRSNKEWKTDNREKCRETNRLYNKKNKERQRLERLKNKDETNEKRRQHRLENKEFRDEHNRKQRERYHAKKII